MNIDELRFRAASKNAKLNSMRGAKKNELLAYQALGSRLMSEETAAGKDGDTTERDNRVFSESAKE